MMGGYYDVYAPHYRVSRQFPSQTNPLPSFYPPRTMHLPSFFPPPDKRGIVRDGLNKERGNVREGYYLGFS